MVRISGHLRAPRPGMGLVPRKSPERDTEESGCLLSPSASFALQIKFLSPLLTWWDLAAPLHPKLLPHSLAELRVQSPATEFDWSTLGKVARCSK